ncbi:unannotated protein [freshwater metagenome]|uniref:Unannotated protein n=1 Tax=freshwater metagenome TaxID=449393 RepID=A0A6J7NNT5_9ZZZZ
MSFRGRKFLDGGTGQCHRGIDKWSVGTRHFVIEDCLKLEGEREPATRPRIGLEAPFELLVESGEVGRVGVDGGKLGLDGGEPFEHVDPKGFGLGGEPEISHATRNAMSGFAHELCTWCKY